MESSVLAKGFWKQLLPVVAMLAIVSALVYNHIHLRYEVAELSYQLTTWPNQSPKHNDTVVRKSRWDSRVVVVPAVYHEWQWGEWPSWTASRSIYLYQRTTPWAPRYCQNTGHEAGVFLKFIVDHYDDLPEQTVFVHADPAHHNVDIFTWIDCLSPNLSYTSLNTKWILERRIVDWPTWPYHQGVAGQLPRLEQCWRNVANIFSKTLTPEPAQELVVSFYCCLQFAASRDVLRRYPLELWTRAYQLLGVNQRCVEGSIDARANWALASGLPDGEPPPDWFSGNWESKLIQGMALEHVISVVLNDEPLNSTPYTQEHFCRNFLHTSVCPGSPCGNDVPLRMDGF